MLREKNKVIARFHLVFDVLITVAAFVGAYFIKKYLISGKIGGLSTGPNYYILLFMVVVIWVFSFRIFNLYASYRNRRLMEVLFNTIQAVGFSLMVFTTLLYALKLQNVSRVMIFAFAGLNMVLLCMAKTAVFIALVWIREKGFNTRNILIVGSLDRAKDILTAIGAQSSSGYRVQGCLDVESSRVGDTLGGGVRIIDTVDNLESILKDTVVDELIFAMPLRLIPDASTYLFLAEKIGVSVRIVPDWQIHHLMYKPDIATVNFERFLDVPTLTLNMITPNDVGLFFKNAFDAFFSCFLLLVLSPFFVLIGIGIKIFSPGPCFYKQKRVGMNGRIFDIYKFRTMVIGADDLLDGLKGMNEADGPAFKLKHDPRVIPFIGTLLRKTSMDEFPQLINVVRGEMSLIGPRPPIPSEVGKYELWQRRRLSMKPGMTCIWQVSPNRNDVSFDGWMKMDLEYIDNWSLKSDLKILFFTLKAVVMGSGR